MKQLLVVISVLIIFVFAPGVSASGDSALLLGPPDITQSPVNLTGMTVLYQDSACTLLLAEPETASLWDNCEGWTTIISLSDTDALFLLDLAPSAHPHEYGVRTIGRLPSGSWIVRTRSGEDLPWHLPGERIRLNLRGINTTRQLPEKPAISFPQPTEADPVIARLVNEVSSDRLRELVQTLEGFQTRFSYSAGCHNAINWAAQFLQDQGLEIETSGHTAGMAPNLIARKPGLTSPDRIWIICAHIDSISLHPQELAPGADDNGTGSALVLHAAEILRDQRFEDTILFALWTGEEQGLYGSTAWAENAGNAGLAIQGVLNFDMVGYAFPAPEDLNVIVNHDSQPFGNSFIEFLEAYTSLAYRLQVSNGMVYSDHAPFWNEGYPAFCGIEDYPINYPDYHKTTDTWDKIDFQFTADVTRSVIAGVCGFARTVAEQPEDDLQISLTMPAHNYHGGDEIWLWYEITRRGPALDADLYLLLDVVGNYYFYPDWTMDLAGVPIYVPADGVIAQEILRFVLPTSLTSGGPYTFLSTVTARGTYELEANISSYDFWFWP